MFTASDSCFVGVLQAAQSRASASLKEGTLATILDMDGYVPFFLDVIFIQFLWPTSTQHVLHVVPDLFSFRGVRVTPAVMSIGSLLHKARDLRHLPHGP